MFFFTSKFLRFLSIILIFLFSICSFVSFVFAADAPLNKAMRKAKENGEFNDLHTSLAYYKGEKLLEVYFNGDDERWGTSLGMVEHGVDTLHDVRSITKSIVGLLYGIALFEGKVPTLNQPLLAQFPQYADLKGDKLRDAILIEHALKMNMGLKWNEKTPYTSIKNSEIAMEYAPDRYRFVLEKPMLHEPGTQWTYNGGAVASSENTQFTCAVRLELLGWFPAG